MQQKSAVPRQAQGDYGRHADHEPKASVWRRLVEAGGSLRLALVLLPSLAAALALGIWVESQYDRRTAYGLVYGSWWFLLLVALLFANILLAAVKKWPWKRHQIGFLVTHLGLLTLISGSVLTLAGGQSGEMVLVDSPAAPERLGPHSSDFYRDSTCYLLRIRTATGALQQEWPFDPGPLAWGEWGPEQATSASPGASEGVARWLQRLAQPFGPGQVFEVGDGLRVEVAAHLPAAYRIPVRPARTGEPSLPAVCYQISSADTGSLAAQWAAYEEPLHRGGFGPVRIEFLARDCLPEHLAEFRHPPRPDPRGKGVLVVGVAGQSARIEVGTGQESSIGNSGWRVRILEYQANYRRPGDPRPSEPAVSFLLTDPQGQQFGLVTLARRAGDLYPLPGQNSEFQKLGGVWVWYHAPDPGYGDDTVRGVLQWATDSRGGLWLRTWSLRSAGEGQMLGLESCQGPVQEGQSYRIWTGMRARLTVQRYLPRAVLDPQFVPASDPLEQAAAIPAVRCRLRKGSHSAVVWLPLTAEEWSPVVLGPDRYLLALQPRWQRLPFRLTLLKAQRGSEAGQDDLQAAWVAVTDPQEGWQERVHRITLNSPLAHRGYRCYQGSYRALGRGPDGKPLGQVTLSITYDPGLYVKYLGSFMVAGGILIMFWMRAYFFRHVPRWGHRPWEEAQVSTEAQP